MPPALRNRAADDWQVLISIADSLGYGEDARAAAVALTADHPDEDAGVVLLIFGLSSRRAKSIASPARP